MIVFTPPPFLTAEQAEAAASMIAEARVTGLADTDVAEVLCWPVWLVTLIADLVLQAEAPDDD